LDLIHKLLDTLSMSICIHQEMQSDCSVNHSDSLLRGVPEEVKVFYQQNID